MGCCIMSGRNIAVGGLRVGDLNKTRAEMPLWYISGVNNQSHLHLYIYYNAHTGATVKCEIAAVFNHLQFDQLFFTGNIQTLTL